MSRDVDYGLLDRVELRFPLFYPSPDRSQAPHGATDSMIEVAEGVALGARHYVGDKGSPTILYFHGNGEVVGDHDGVALLYRGYGLDLFVVDYRGYGRSGGQPSFATLVEDAHAVAARFHRMLDEQGATGPRFVMGRSLGSHPALELAANGAARFEGLILESAAADLRRLMGRFATPVPADVSDALVAAHEAKIARVALPVLMLHGEVDELIPLAHAEHVHGLLTSKDRSLVVIPRAGHNDILFRGGEQYFEAIRAFVDRCSKG